MDRKRTIALIAAILVALLWGMSFVSTKAALADFPPMTLAVLRFAIACAILPLCIRIAKSKISVAARDLPVLALSGFFGVTLYFLGENYGIDMLTASESSLVMATIPVATVVADRVFSGTRYGFKAIAGAALSFVGVALIVVRTRDLGSSWLGYVFMAVASIAWVAYMFVSRKVAARTEGLVLTFWQCLFGMIGCIPFALLEMKSWKQPGNIALINLAYLAIFCSAMGYWLYIISMNRLGIAKASVFINVIPVVAVVGAFVFLGERLAFVQLIGGAIAISGVYLATTARSAELPEAVAKPPST